MNKLIKKAFTLIELLVVIAIIGILSGLIVVSMGGMTNKATIAKAKVFSNSLRNSLMMNIVGEWKFDSVVGTVGLTLVNGTVVSDSWSTNNGTTAGGPTLKDGTDCVSGQCLNFDGSNDYVNCGSGSNLNFGENSFTLSAWVKVIDAAYSLMGDVAIIDKQGGWAFFSRRDDSYIEFMVYDGAYKAQYFLNGYNQIKDGKWHLLTIVENYGVNGILYIDGNRFATSTVTFGSIDSGVNLSLGYSRNSGKYFSGSLDDVRVFNAGISTSQIKGQYYAGLNKMLANGNINNEEYKQRIEEISLNK